jgi:broad specificity phosphatase PhoE
VELIVVRHGETAWSRTRQMTGRTDLPLTTEGEIEARALAPLLEAQLAGREPLVVSSPLQRARRTCALAMAGHEPRIDPRVAELDYGEYEGLTAAEVSARVGAWSIWRDPCPGGEHLDAAKARADAFIAEVLDPSEAPVVVFSHGHFSRILTARVLGLEPALGRLFALSTASMSVVADIRGERSVGLWNLSAHQGARPPDAG